VSHDTQKMAVSKTVVGRRGKTAPKVKLLNYGMKQFRKMASFDSPPFLSGWIHYCVLLFLVTALGEMQDRSQHPGHLLPFGHPSAGPRFPIPEVSAFPSPATFVKDFVLPGQPVLMKGVYKDAPAFALWDDEYFRTIYEPVESLVNVETMKKEDRNQIMVQMPFKSFVLSYHKKSVYMVNPVPRHLERDATIPYSLQCPGLGRLFRRNMMWMSSGGTKSVVHIDDYENLNCLVRGRKELILVDRRKYPKAVPLDRSAETFSSLDVDAVDYIKYPSMVNVGEYHFANMTAGDCLYIPYKWIHQVRSHDRNIAVNLWWDQAGTRALDLDKCQRASSSDPELTLRNVDWEDSSSEEDETFRTKLLSIAEEEDLTFPLLHSLFFDDNFTGKSIFANLPQSHEIRGTQWLRALFSQLDLDADDRVTAEELNSLSEERWKEVEKMEEEISSWIEGLLTDSVFTQDEL